MSRGEGVPMLEEPEARAQGSKNCVDGDNDELRAPRGDFRDDDDGASPLEGPGFALSSADEDPGSLAEPGWLDCAHLG